MLRLGAAASSFTVVRACSTVVASTVVPGDHATPPSADETAKQVFNPFTSRFLSPTSSLVRALREVGLQHDKHGLWHVEDLSRLRAALTTSADTSSAPPSSSSMAGALQRNKTKTMQIASAAAKLRASIYPFMLSFAQLQGSPPAGGESSQGKAVPDTDAAGRPLTPLERVAAAQHGVHATIFERALSTGPDSVLQLSVDTFLREAQKAAVESGGRPGLPSRLQAPLVVNDVANTDLTADQLRVMELVVAGHSVLIGGRAGTGKTVLLRSLHQRLTEEFGLQVGLTAMTGVAGVHLGGCTFHHGLGIPVVPGKLGHRWDGRALRALDVLVVDEVSMLSASMLERLDEDARFFRNNAAPFGGIQVVLCGDFMQLTPNTDSEHKPCFASRLLDFITKVELVTPLRHRVDTGTFTVLSELRLGHLPRVLEESVLTTRPSADSVRDATFIFPKRRAAEEHNEAALATLQGIPRLFLPQRGDVYMHGEYLRSCFASFPADSGVAPSAYVAHVEKALTSALVSTLSPALKSSSRVASGAVNDPSAVVVLHTPSGSTDAHRVLLRLRVPWKAAGVDSGDVDAGRKDGGASDSTAAVDAWWRSAAQAAVASCGGTCVFSGDESLLAGCVPMSTAAQLSEANAGLTGSKPLYLKLGCRVMVTRNLSPTIVNGTCGTVVAFEKPNSALFPDPWSARAVLARLPNRELFPELPVLDVDGQRVQIPPVFQMVGGSAATQHFAVDMFTIPLQLGYGFTVHKVQGLTLTGKVVVDCTDSFRCPHLIYVACSRVRSLDQLTLVNVNPKQVIANTDCLDFVSTLQPGDGDVQIPSNAVVAQWKTIHQQQQKQPQQQTES